MTLVYKREGYAQTRDALAWVGTYAPALKFGLTLEDVFNGLEHPCEGSSRTWSGSRNGSSRG
jgi:hypothetical protein